jgi:hypothetical protein
MKSHGSIVPTRDFRIGLVVSGRKLIAVKLLPDGVRALVNAFVAEPRDDFGESRFLAIEDDKLTPRAGPLHVGSWLGVRVYLDLRAILAARQRNGA